MQLENRKFITVYKFIHYSKIPLNKVKNANTQKECIVVHPNHSRLYN